MYEKIQFHLKILANRQLMLVVNKHEISYCMYLVLTRVNLRRSQVVIVFELAKLAKPGYHSLLEVAERDAIATLSLFRVAVLVHEVNPFLSLLVQGLRLGVHDFIHPGDEVIFDILFSFIDPAVMSLIVRVHRPAPCSVLLFIKTKCLQASFIQLSPLTCCLPEVGFQGHHLLHLEVFISLHQLVIGQALVLLGRGCAILPILVIFNALLYNLIVHLLEG